MTRLTRMLRARLAGALAMLPLLALLGCEHAYDLTEGTTEAGNPAKVAGQIYDAEGNGVSALVRLIPEAYRNQGPGDDRPFAYETMADNSGKFHFPGVVSGRFNLLAKATGNGGRLLVRSLNIVRDTDLTNTGYVARDPATVKIDLSPVPEGAPGYVYIEGTDLTWYAGAGDWALGYLLLDSVPAGALPDIWFAMDNHPAADDILLSRNALTTPGDTVAAGKTGVLPKSGITVLIPPEPDTTMMDSVLSLGSSASVTDFPLLLRLDTGNFDFSRSKLRGRDCRFSDRAGRPLAYSIESWDSAGSQASVWLRIDTVRAAAGANPVFLRIGKGAADSTALGAGVFDQAHGWRGVWHFTDADTGAHVYAEDATRSGNEGGSLSWRGFSMSGWGIAGRSVNFNGKDDGLSAPLPVQASEAFTVSLWFRTGTGCGGVLFDFSQNYMGAGDRQIWMDDAGQINYHVWTGSNSHTTITHGGLYNDGRWHHLAATFGGGKQTMYLDGKAAGSYATGASLPMVAGNWTIGYGRIDGNRQRMPSSLHFQGEIDEARISADIRNSAWVHLSYETQKPQAATKCAR